MRSTPDNRAPDPEAEADHAYRGLIVVIVVLLLTVTVSVSILITLPEALDGVTQQRSGWLGGYPTVAAAPGTDTDRH